MTRNDREFFNSIAHTWDQTRAHRQERLDMLIRRTGMKPGERVLDLGCGTGVLLPFIVQAIGPTGSVTGVDIADKMVDVAAKKFSQFPNNRLIRSDIMDYEAVQPFDHITCLNFYPHIQDKAAFLQRALERWLKSGGWLHLFHDLSRAEVNAIHGGCQAVREDRLTPGDTVAALLEAAGFGGVSFDEGETHYFVQGQKPIGTQTTPQL